MYKKLALYRKPIHPRRHPDLLLAWLSRGGAVAKLAPAIYEMGGTAFLPSYCMCFSVNLTLAYGSEKAKTTLNDN
jgi:hypothetical protein